MIYTSTFRRILAAAILIGTASASSLAHAQASATATANANATIAKPITISNTAALDFGEIVPNSTGNGTLTVTIDTAGTRSIAGDVDGALFGGTVGAAAFDVTGRPNAAYSIQVPAAPVNLTGAITGDTMSVGTFLDSKSGSSSLSAGPGTGSDSFTVGATLSVGEAQAADSYTGTFPVTVAYN